MNGEELDEKRIEELEKLREEYEKREEEKYEKDLHSWFKYFQGDFQKVFPSLGSLKLVVKYETLYQKGKPVDGYVNQETGEMFVDARDCWKATEAIIHEFIHSMLVEAQKPLEELYNKLINVLNDRGESDPKLKNLVDKIADEINRYKTLMEKLNYNLTEVIASFFSKEKHREVEEYYEDIYRNHVIDSYRETHS